MVDSADRNIRVTGEEAKRVKREALCIPDRRKHHGRASTRLKSRAKEPGTQQRVYRFRFCPSPAQSEQLEKTFGACRWVYNEGLTDPGHRGPFLPVDASVLVLSREGPVVGCVGAGVDLHRVRGDARPGCERGTEPPRGGFAAVLAGGLGATARQSAAACDQGIRAAGGTADRVNGPDTGVTDRRAVGRYACGACVRPAGCDPQGCVGSAAGDEAESAAFTAGQKPVALPACARSKVRRSACPI